MTEQQGDIASSSSEKLLEKGEAALARGDSAEAMELLAETATAGVEPPLLGRLTRAYTQAGRFQNQQDQVLAWIEKVLPGISDVPQRSIMLRARVAVCRQTDLNRVLGLAEEALIAAEQAHDEHAYVSVAANAAFAGYRTGDTRVANEFAQRAADKKPTTPTGAYDVVRAQMFAAAAGDDLELVLNLAIKARALSRDLNRLADAANESNNIASAYLDLGCPTEARACAMAAIVLSEQSGHQSVGVFGQVLAAVATAEGGDIDAALDAFAQISTSAHNRIVAVDAASAYSFWLLERRAAGDTKLAREITQEALEQAHGAGVSNSLTSLYSNLARCIAREGNETEARDALEKGRRAADRAESSTQSLLALGVAEVFPVSEPKRRHTLQGARARILRHAERREDPLGYCIHVRTHRRLLELSGGIPDDLPTE